VPILETIIPELKAQIERVGKLPDQDLAEGYDGVFLDDAIEVKYPKTLLGHSSLKTTMIYTHCVPVMTIKEPKSQLDF
jgi:integrase